jgi:hypothetical protein
MKEFIPPRPRITPLIERVGHPVLRTLYSEAGFIRRSFPLRPNHLTLGELPLCYVRIPRAGSTSVVRHMLLSQLPRLANESPGARDINLLADVYMKRQLRNDDRHKTFFTMVRNPFARIVSVYRAFFEDSITPFLYEDYLFGVFRKQMTFREFVEALERIPDSLKDQHVKPQHLFLRPYERQGINVRVFRLEHPGDVGAFLKNFGIAFEVFNASRSSYDYRSYYEADLVRIVGHIYRIDLERFGYTWNPEDF